jgi:hypothetical protein
MRAACARLADPFPEHLPSRPAQHPPSGGSGPAALAAFARVAGDNDGALGPAGRQG